MTQRGVFFEEEGARAVAGRLQRDGFRASVVREPFAGEDDDEDHAWAVLTDAPPAMLELLVDERDGWLDDDSAEAAPAPVELPTGPRRKKES